MGYLKESIKGVGWMGALRTVTRLLAFAKIAILARILVPEQFGLFGIASLILAFLEILTATGINVFFIQGEGKIKDYLNTAWIVSIARGCVISLIVFLASTPVALFFNAPGSLNLIRLIAVVPIIRGFVNPAVISYRKRLLFNKEFYFRSLLFLIESLFTVGFVLITRNVSSLVVGMIAGGFLEVVLSFTLFTERPRLSFEIEKVKKVIKRGKWVTIAGIFNYLFENGDDAVVGRLLNTGALGYYQVAYKISTLPISEVRQTVVKVAFPVYSRISGDKERLKKAYIKTLLTISVFATILGLFIFFFAESVVLILLGINWLRIVPVLKVLSIFGILKAIITSSYPVFNSVKKQEYVAYATFVNLVIMALTIIPFVKNYGIVGAGYSAIIGTVASLPFILIYLARILR